MNYKKIMIFIASLVLSNLAYGCDTEFIINLKTFGQSVIVELRSGVPGASKVVETKRSSGGRVSYSNLCSGSYFLAIGDSESVDVTPARQFQDGVSYESNITLQRGSGNVAHKKRSSL